MWSSKPTPVHLSKGDKNSCFHRDHTQMFIGTHTHQNVEAPKHSLAGEWQDTKAHRDTKEQTCVSNPSSWHKAGRLKRLPIVLLHLSGILEKGPNSDGHRSGLSAMNSGEVLTSKMEHKAILRETRVFCIFTVVSTGLRTLVRTHTPVCQKASYCT